MCELLFFCSFLDSALGWKAKSHDDTVFKSWYLICYCLVLRVNLTLCLSLADVKLYKYTNIRKYNTNISVWKRAGVHVDDADKDVNLESWRDSRVIRAFGDWANGGIELHIKWICHVLFGACSWYYPVVVKESHLDIFCLPDTCMSSGFWVVVSLVASKGQKVKNGLRLEIQSDEI